MSFVEMNVLPPPDPVNGFIVPCDEVMFAIQSVDHANLSLQGEEICPLTLEKLADLDKLGFVLWAQKDKGPCTLQWEYLCISSDKEQEQEQECKRLHIFDYEMVKGLLLSRKEFFKCPLCFRGAVKKEKVVQEDAEFIENLLERRKDCLQSSDQEMAIYWEVQIVRQFLEHYEQERALHEQTCIDIIRQWSELVLESSFDQVLTKIIECDYINMFRELYEVIERNVETDLMERACKAQSGEIIAFLLEQKGELAISQQALMDLIIAQNEYLLDLVLDYYKQWQSSAKPELLLSSRDWTDLGLYCLVHEQVYFIRAVQRKGIFRLKSRLRMDPRVDEHRLVELGLVLAGEDDEALYMNGDEDGEDWGDQEDDDDDDDDWDDDSD